MTGHKSIDFDHLRGIDYFPDILQTPKIIDFHGRDKDNMSSLISNEADNKTSKIDKEDYCNETTDTEDSFGEDIIDSDEYTG